jgi:ATP-dependent RNA helicase RhlE
LRFRFENRIGVRDASYTSLKREFVLSTETTFEELGLVDSLLRAVRAEGYETATPIQQKAIGPVLAGHDLMGCAQTGTGKTAAFALPTLQRLSVGSTTLAVENDGQDQIDHNNNHRGNDSRHRGRRDSQRRPARSNRPIRALVLAPTRELAAQIGASFGTYGKFTGLRYAVVYGGVGQGPQVRALQQGVDILVATPGRLEDLMEQGFIDLRRVEILILDEADQMLDMGFIVPLRRIVSSTPDQRQTLMFTATMPPEIRKLTTEWLSNPTHIEVAPVVATTELVEQSVHFVEPRDKLEKLQHFLENTAYKRALVFSRTKRGADKIVKQLSKNGIRSAALHSNKSQSVRQRTLEQFKGNRPPVLVATDIAARGLDVDAISHVVNFDLPEVAEVYVHRIGRTGRAGASGVATSFVGREERDLLRQIERLMKRKLTVEGEEPHWIHESSSGSNGGGNRGGNRNGRGRSSGNVPRGASGGKRPRRRTDRRDDRPAAAARSGGSTNGAAASNGGATSGESSSRPSRPKKKRILARL